MAEKMADEFLPFGDAFPPVVRAIVSLIVTADSTPFFIAKSRDRSPRYRSSDESRLVHFSLPTFPLCFTIS